MTAFLEPREGVLIARAGEEIVCPECGSLIGIFTADALLGATPPVSYTERHRMPSAGGCFCGGSASIAGEEGTAVRELTDCVAPRLHLRSGAWVGWRGLGE